ncbi:hypothetical protein TRFO_22518 [Tritrichomonas foetus]|uniref:Transmembrane protein n=1 Tax=Tritrichomonas foetus TaxID=1144522 RepID=A0A1J4KCA3_9EUKA|nr:hypothetical protein TRFO_22518 [Tritrichomonas foetus]|eukprot:OHT08851.1 hypothetical protein TRFO_22518 [Tritrichomonas foetus]
MSFEVNKQDNEDFAEVELAANVGAGSHFYIENTPAWSFIVTMLIFAAFIGMHLYAAIMAPELLSTKDEFFKLNSTEENVSIDVDITLSQLQNLHRFVDVNGSLITKTNKDFNLPIDVVCRTTFLSNFTVISNENSDKTTTNLVFHANSNQSSYFPVIHKTVNNYDSVQIKMTVTTNYHDIAGFQFHWAFSNPSAEKYNRAAKLLMSLLVGYMLVHFVFYLKFDAESFTQIFCIILGIAGIFSSNPIAYLLRDESTKLSDFILMAAFTGIFRTFILCQLELLRSHSQTPKTYITAIFAVLFSIHTAVDSTASYDRANFVASSESEVPVVLQMETVHVAFNVIYVILSIAYLIVAAIQNDGANPRRLLFFAIVVVLTALTTAIAQTYFVLTSTLMFSVIPQMLCSAIYITCAAFSLYLLHPGGGPEYRQVGEGKDDVEPMVLDVQQMSDGDDAELDDDEEEDEEEEEEEE